MEEFKIWIEKAEKDFKTAKFNISGGEIEAGLFFLQQSAEKALKALYIKRKKQLIKTHDLVSLADTLKAHSHIRDYCTILSPLYHQTRYPDIPSDDLSNSINEFISAVGR